MGVSENYGTPKSSILIGFSIINHPFWGTPIFGNIHIECVNLCSTAYFDWRCWIYRRLLQYHRKIYQLGLQEYVQLTTV